MALASAEPALRAGLGKYALSDRGIHRSAEVPVGGASSYPEGSTVDMIRQLFRRLRLALGGTEWFVYLNTVAVFIGS